MNWSVVYATAVLAVTPLVASAQQPDLKGRPVTFQACVSAGVPATTVRLNNVKEVGSTLLPLPPPIQIVYWMNKPEESRFVDYVGADIEVVARIVDLPDRRLNDLSANDGVFGVEDRIPAQAAVTPASSGGFEAEPESKVLKIDIEKVIRLGPGKCAWRGFNAR